MEGAGHFVFLIFYSRMRMEKWLHQRKDRKKERKEDIGKETL